MLLPGKQGLRGHAVTQAVPTHLIWDGFNRFPGRRHLAAGGGGVDGGGGCARHKAQAQQERDTASHGCGLALHAGAGQVGDVRRGGGRSRQIPGTGAGYPLWAGHPGGSPGPQLAMPCDQVLAARCAPRHVAQSPITLHATGRAPSRPPNPVHAPVCGQGAPLQTANAPCSAALRDSTCASCVLPHLNCRSARGCRHAVEL